MVRKSADNILILLSCFLMIFSLYQLYFRAYLLEGGHDRINIAKLDGPIQTVKFKEKSSFSWKDARHGLGLATGDRVYTHEDSVARIKFTKGIKISMDPSTLLEIKDTDQNLGLNIKSGNVSTTFTNKTDNITLLIGEKRLILGSQKKGTTLRISKEKDSTKISVLSGSINIKQIDSSKSEVYSKKLEKAEIQIGTNTNIEKSIITKIPIQFMMSPPKLIRDFPKKAYEIRWKAPTRKGKYLFTLETPSGSKKQISSKRNFLKIVPKTPGLYHYQVVSSNSLKSAKLSFLYQPYKTPKYAVLNKVVSELKEQQLAIELENRPYNQTAVLTDTSGVVIEEWRPKSTDKNNSTVTLPIKQKLTTNKRYFLTIRAEGTQLVNFSVRKEISTMEKTILSAPRLAKNSVVKIYTFGEVVPTLLKWQSATMKGQYEIKVQNNGAQKVYISSQKEFSLEIEPNNSDITWQVRQITANGISPWSVKGNLIVQNVDITNHVPAQGTEVFLDKPNQLVEFKWIAKSQARYQFELSREPSFKDKLVSKSTVVSTMKLPIGAKGRYYWKVMIMDQKGNPIEQVKPIQIKVSPSPAPSPLKLQDKIEIKIRSKKATEQKAGFIEKVLNLLVKSSYASDSSASLTWQADPLAKSYIIRIYARAQDSKSIIEKRVDSNSFEWPNPKPGKYYWDVSIVDFWDREGVASNRSQLTLTQEVAKKSVESKTSQSIISLSHPAHRSNLSAPEEAFSFTIPKTEVKELYLQFSKDLNFIKPKVEIKLKPKFGNYTIRLRRSAFSKSLGIREKDSFRLYWRVTTKDNGQKSLRRLFTWQPIQERPTHRIHNIAAKKSSSLKVFQEYSSTTLEQESPEFATKAKGFFVNSIGIEKQFNIVYPLTFSLRAGTAKAFQKLRYNSAQFKAILFPPRIQYTKWDLGMGASINYQTFFIEKSNSSLAEDQSLLPLAHLLITRNLTKGFKLSFGVAAGSGFKYRANINKVIGKVLKREASLGILYEAMTFKEGAIEVEQKSIGINWTLAVLP